MQNRKHDDCEHCQHPGPETMGEMVVDVRQRVSSALKSLEDTRKKHGSSFFLSAVERFLRFVSSTVEKKFKELPPGDLNKPLALTDGKDTAQH